VSRARGLALLLLAGSLWLPAGAAPQGAPSPGQSRLPSAEGAQTSTEIRDRYGRPLRTVLAQEGESRSPVRLEEVSPWMPLATLAAEDRRFFSHAGVDLRAVARALWQNARSGRRVSGGSTLSEQLVRALHPRPRTWGGKLAEAFDALLLETRQDKREILEGYLNEVSYGNRCRGIGAAAREYFGVPASELTLAQSALLAGVPKSPKRYDPRRYPEAAAVRQRRVLERMREWGWLDADSHRLARAEKLKVEPRRAAFAAPQFTEYVLRRAERGAVIDTTLDAGLQERLQGVLAKNLERLAGHQVTNGAAVVLDNATGDILAWVGSADFNDPRHQGQVDGVTAPRQPGSALKPFAYGLALSLGARASDLLRDEPMHFTNGFSPKNYDETFHGPVRLREALACSFNIPAVRVAERFGAARLLGALRAFGLESLRESADHYGIGLVLGNGEVSLLELTNAYAALARGGVWMPVRALPGEAAAARRVLDRESAFIVTDILADNAARAGAFGLNSPLHLPFPFAAKTGTSKDYRDNWALGYTPEWTIGVWVGNFDGQPMRRVSGISGAAPVLRDAALLVYERSASGPFPVPAGIRELEVCPESGDQPGPWCPGAMREVFAKKHPPARVCSLHRPPVEIASVPAPRRPALLSVEFPQPGDVFKIDPATPLGAQALRLRAASEESVAWTVDGVALPPGEAWWALRPGRHRAAASLRRDGRLLQSRPVHFLVVR